MDRERPNCDMCVSGSRIYQSGHVPMDDTDGGGDKAGRKEDQEDAVFCFAL